MSVQTMVDTFDMPMIDFNEDGDIPMGASSSENWFQPLPRMDEDAHDIDAFSESQEIDMMAFEETTTEYEMIDEAAQPHTTNVDTNVVDAEVYDVTVHSSPVPPPSSTAALQSQTAQLEMPESATITTDESQTDFTSRLTTAFGHDSDPIHSFSPSEVAEPRGDSSVLPVSLRSEHVPVAVAPESSHEHQEKDLARSGEATISERLPQEVPNADETHLSLPSEQGATPLHPEDFERRPDSVHDGEPPDPSSEVGSNEPHHVLQGAEAHYDADGEEVSKSFQTPDDESANADKGVADQLDVHANQQVYIQPPPPILLTLQVASAEGDQPDFVLFNLPESTSHTTEEPLLLLQHRPSLFFEPVSTVFEAFRQEEYFSHLEELSEAEMVLNAYDLQLVISEDNIYAREVSLQDLHAMHQGVGLPGHLRLTLQSIVPRFIVRYNHLRDQITRLVLGGGEGDGTQQDTENADGEEHESQEQEKLNEEEQDLNEPEQGLDHSQVAEGVETVRENEGVENTEGAQENSGQVDSDHNEEDEPQVNEPDNENGQNSDIVDSEQQQDNATLNERDDDDASGEEEEEEEEEEEGEATYELDADALHAIAASGATEPQPGEYETEYVEVVEPHEEGDEGEVDGLRQDEEESTGATEGVTVPLESDRPGQLAGDSSQGSEELYEVDAEAISHSTSVSSSGADDSSWTDAAEENDIPAGIEHETDQSTQQATATTYDEEGNYTGAFEGDEDEFDEDGFGEEDFDDSAEGTLEDSAETQNPADAIESSEKEDDAASHAILAESEKFVSNLENDGKEAGANKEQLVPTDNDISATLDQASVVEETSGTHKILHKNTSKRSLDDAELDGEESVSPPSSPDSKRTRTL